MPTARAEQPAEARNADEGTVIKSKSPCSAGSKDLGREPMAAPVATSYTNYGCRPRFRLRNLNSTKFLGLLSEIEGLEHLVHFFQPGALLLALDHLGDQLFHVRVADDLDVAGVPGLAVALDRARLDGSLNCARSISTRTRSS